MKPKVLFFARDYQAEFFPLLKSDKYDSVFVALNLKEKNTILKNGGIEVICLEEEFDNLPLADISQPYLKFSFGCDRNYQGLSLDERTEILRKTITFWRNILEKYNPNLIVNETVAIEVSEVLAIEAERKKIKYISWMSFPKKNTFYWQIDPFHNSLGSALDSINPTEEHLIEAANFIKNLRDGLQKPFYIKNKSTRYSFYNLAKNFVIIYREFVLMLKMPKLKRRASYGTSLGISLWYIKLFFLSVFNFSKPYDDFSKYKDRELLFYPLHYEPEAVLFYMAYFFDSQINVIENTLKCLNQNQILIVKEHPQQPGALLEKKFRDIKKRYPNLLFVRGEEKSSQILTKCSTVISLGSTAAFEALALDKKVINLGLVFYDTFEGTNNCDSFQKVYDLIRGNRPFDKRGDFQLFVAKMLTYIKPGNPFPHDEIYSPANILAITSAIENELN